MSEKIQGDFILLLLVLATYLFWVAVLYIMDRRDTKATKASIENYKKQHTYVQTKKTTGK